MRELHELSEPFFEAVESVTGVRVEQLVGSGRKQDVVDARRLLVYLLRTKRGMGWADIGCAFGRHHNNRMAYYRAMEFGRMLNHQAHPDIAPHRGMQARRWYAECVKLIPRIEAFEDAA